LEFLLRKIKKPASILLSIFLSRNSTLDDAYKLAYFVKTKLKNLIVKIKKPNYGIGEEIIKKLLEISEPPYTYDSHRDELELFFFSAPIDESMEDIIRVVIFWAEKEV